MKKSWGLLLKILSGEKKIESRWYLNKSRPWNGISAGDLVYFKNSGEPVTVKTEVSKVLQFENLTPEKTDEIFRKYGKKIGLTKNIYRQKKYGILVFLKNPKKVKPFEIDKTGFGLQSAWLTTDKIAKLRKSGK